MKSIKQFLKKFSALEFLIMTVSLLVSLIAFSIGISAKSSYDGNSNNGEDDPVFLRKLSESATIYDINGVEVAPFDTEFSVNYETNHPEDFPKVITTLDTYVVPYHKLFDRHHYYFLEAPSDEKNPTALEKETLERVKNLNYINDHFDEDIKIEKPLYELLTFAKEKTVFSANNASGSFNMFIGGLYDFWTPYLNGNIPELNEDPHFNSENAAVLSNLVKAIPKTEGEINNTINLWQEEDSFYVRLSKFDSSVDILPSISLGATGKGYMADVLKKELTKQNLIHGLINGGTSSITFLKPGSEYKANVNIAINGVDGRFGKSAITVKRNDLFVLSTSGITEGYKFNDLEGKEVIRGHIIDPLTGYPAQNSQHLVSLFSNELSGLELDYLTTTLIVLPLSEAINLLNTHYNLINYSVLFIGYEEGSKFIAKSNDFPGGDGHIISQNSEYKENFPDLL